MKIVVKVLREIKFVIDLVSEDGQVLGHIPLTPDISMFAKFYEEENNKWLNGKLVVRDGVIWFVIIEKETSEEKESWPVDEKDLENTNMYNLWNSKNIF